MPLPVPRGKQREVVALKHVGHIVVLGTAGSGKTTMAIHRAAFLANQLADHGGRTLLTTFNNTLVTYLEHLRPPELANVDVVTYHRFARGYLASRNLMSQNAICSPAHRERLIDQAVRRVAARHEGLSLFMRPTAFFSDEIQWMNQHGIEDRDDYVRRGRIGRSNARLTREQRPAMYEVLNEYHALRAAAGRSYDWDDLASAARRALEEDDDPRRYRHVVLDEGQDFSPEMVRSLALATPDDGSLTMFADVAQQIYGRRLTWSDAGLNAGTPWKFERNYRNSPQIAALGLAIARMPYYAGEPDMVAPTEFAAAGPPPTVVSFESEDAETAFVIEQAQNAAASGSVGILLRRNADVPMFASRLPRAQLVDRDLVAWNPDPGVSIGTAHGAKGLEFDTVIMPGMTTERWPDQQLIAKSSVEEAEASDGRLLYVGVTRARQGLILTHAGQLTALMPKNRGLWTEVQR
ncbi:MAG: AAA family ATPase [Chloroflexota bacterium]|nr:AAA family ATPase [Chloroflexota bacterium]